MTQEITVRLSRYKKLLLATAATAALGLPLALGILHASENVQSQAGAGGPLPSFEVAAIKLNNSGSNSSYWSDRPGKMIATNITLAKLIQRAYRVSSFQISGPDWLKSEHFDIQAEAPASTQRDQYLMMMQRLLIDRFKFAFHWEQKIAAGYALVVAKNGLKLEAVQGSGESGVSSSRGHMSLRKASISEIADSLSRRVERPVLDKTGLQGAFNGELQWTPDDEQASSSNQSNTAASLEGPSLFTALEEQWGLKLVPRKDSIEILVIDHVERVPTEN